MTDDEMARAYSKSQAKIRATHELRDAIRRFIDEHGDPLTERKAEPLLARLKAIDEHEQAVWN